MTKVKEAKSELGFDAKRCERAYERLLTVFQEERLSVGEIIIALGNLTYALGASIDGYGDKGPTVEQLEKLYYTNPSVGVAMMIQGLTIASWYEQYRQQVLDNTKE